jgi:hypothetical protein
MHKAIAVVALTLVVFMAGCSIRINTHGTEAPTTPHGVTLGPHQIVVK